LIELEREVEKLKVMIFDHYFFDKIEGEFQK